MSALKTYPSVSRMALPAFLSFSSKKVVTPADPGTKLQVCAAAVLLAGAVAAGAVAGLAPPQRT